MNAPPPAWNLFENPLIRRYRRSQMRPVRLWATVVITLVIAGFIATMCYLPLRYRVGFTVADAARTAFLPLLIYQAIILGFFGTAAIGSGILRESEEGMIEYQRLTPLSPLAKVLGYLFGLPIRQYVAFGVTACFSAFSIIAGQIPFHAWGSVYLVLFSSSILYHLFALITGLVIKSRWRAGLTSLGLVVVLNVVLPRLAEFGFAMFSHLTVWPVVQANLSDLLPARSLSAGFSRLAAMADVPFWNQQIPHVAFALVVQGSLIGTFILILVRRWRDEEAHLLGKAYAVGWLLWLQIILLGNVLPLVERGRVFMGVFGNASDLAREFRRLPGPFEAYVLAVLYGAISLLILLPVISCITPRPPTQMIALRQRKKFGYRRVPWLADGATATPFVWLAAILTGGAWAIFAERLSTSPAYGLSGFPIMGWFVFIGVAFMMGAIFHFLLEGYSRRMAWMALFLAGFLPLFASLVLLSIDNTWGDTARYLTSLSPLSAPWQPIQWQQQAELARLPAGAGRGNFGPFVLFCVIHVGLGVALFAGWRRRRRARVARA